ncbi:vomeronasal type-2 receptor 26-like [Lissotriton helveticus]
MDSYLVKKVNQINNERRASLGLVDLPLLHDEAFPLLGDTPQENSDAITDQAIITAVVQVHRESLDVLPDTSLEESEQVPPVTRPLRSCRKCQSKRGGKHSKKRPEPPLVVCNGPIVGPCPVDGNKVEGTLNLIEHLDLLVSSIVAKIEAKMEDMLKPLNTKLDTVSLEVDRLGGILSAYMATIPAGPSKVVDNVRSVRKENLQLIGRQAPAIESASSGQQLATVQNRQNREPLVESEGRLWKMVADSQRVPFLDMVLAHVIIITRLWEPSSAVAAMDRTTHCRIFTPNMESYSKEGDVIFGILAPVHLENIIPPTNFLFREPPAPSHCLKIDNEFYQSVLAMVFTINEINQSPHILPNTTLGFRIYDSCYSILGAIGGTLLQLSGGKESIPNYSCQSTPRLAGIIGDGLSTLALSMARLLGAMWFPQISYGAALPILSDKVQFPAFLRTVTSLSIQPHALVQLLLYFGWTWIGILTSNNDLGLQGSQVLRDEAARNGICVEFFEILPTQITQASLSHIIAIVERSTVNVIVCHTYVMQIMPILKEISKRQIYSKIWTGVTMWVPSPVFSERDLWITLNGTLGFALQSGGIPGFTEYLLNKQPLKDTEDIFLMSAWEDFFSCKWLPILNGNMTESKEICSGTEKIQSLDTSVFDVHDFRFAYCAHVAVYVLAQALHDLLHCKPQEGPFANMSCADPVNFQPWQMLHYVKNVYIRTPAGNEFFFDSNGDSQPFLELLNWHMNSNDTSRFVKVGTFDATSNPALKLESHKNSIVWGRKLTQVPLSICSESCAPGYRKSAIAGRPHCCFNCIPCPPGSIANKTDSLDCTRCPVDHWSSSENDICIPKESNFLSYEEPLGFILAFSSIFLFVNAVGILGIFIWYRHTPVVRANNVQLSYFLLIAIMLCSLCSLVFIGQPSRMTCILRQVIFGMSFTLCISSVLAKTATVVIAFKATKPNSSLRKWVGYKTSYYIVLSCSFTQTSIVAVWLGTSAPFPELNMTAFNWKIVAECNEGFILMFYCMLAFLGVLAFISFGIAFLARNLPDRFNEAKFITFSMVVFLSVWFSFIPAYLSTKGKYVAAVEVFAILSSAAGLLYCIFAPKIYIIFRRPDINIKGNIVSTSSRASKNQSKTKFQVSSMG